MKYFDINCVKSAYDNFQEKLTNKSWGLLCVMRQLDRTIVPGQTYTFNGKALSEYIENLFCLSIGKTYKDNAWYVKFSSQWYDFFKQQSKAEKPNVFDAIVWAYRKESFSDILSDTDLIKKFAEDFHVEYGLISSIFDTTPRSLSYDTVLYTETALKNEIFVAPASDNITAEKKTVTASVGELSRGPFIQPLYGALENSAFFLISQVDFDKIYPFNGDKCSKITHKKLPIQQIFYGAPGTGKSHTINETTKQQPTENVFRTTFHPDSDYSTFVGCYKPTKESAVTQNQQSILDYDTLVDKFKEYLGVKDPYQNITRACTLFGYDFHDSIVRMQESNTHTIPELVADAYKSGTTYDSQVRAGMACYEESVKPQISSSKITYSFVPQTFTKAYLRAWQTEEPVYLVIEEINRGNCAQIFGDLFQLLDRKDGVSEYPIKADNDLAVYIGEELAKEAREDIPENVKSGEELVLPSNLYIWATMNTSDQSLFPIDSAFKRRWDWTYIPIDTTKESWNINADGVNYDWSDFLEKINAKIESATSSEDKMLGFYFCKAENEVITAERFVNKVVFYLWNDVFKDYGFDDAVFNDENNEKLTFRKFYTAERKVDESKVKRFLENLGVKNDKTPEPEAQE